MPTLASPTVGAEILGRLQAISAPYGTEVTITDDPLFDKVGVIDVAPARDDR
jgi:hypothetical protein